MTGRERGELLRKVALRSAIALVVANIVGSGIFTTTGFQAAELGHAGYIYLLWIVGGIAKMLKVMLGFKVICPAFARNLTCEN